MTSFHFTQNVGKYFGIYLGISNALEEISSPSQSNVFLYFFAFITEEGLLFSPCYSWKARTQVGISDLSPLPFSSLLFSGICKSSSDKQNFAFLHFFFLEMMLITTYCPMP